MTIGEDSRKGGNTKSKGRYQSNCRSHIGRDNKKTRYGGRGQSRSRLKQGKMRHLKERITG